METQTLPFRQLRHGLPYLPLQLTPLQLGVMRAIKCELDPTSMLAPDNLF